jgi:hypothetical protein
LRNQPAKAKSVSAKNKHVVEWTQCWRNKTWLWWKLRFHFLKLDECLLEPKCNEALHWLKH